MAARPGGHLVVGRTEHPAVLRAAERRRGGHPVTWVVARADGVVDAGAWRAALRDDTVLVAAMRVNNETGAENDVGAIADAAHEAGRLAAVRRGAGAGLERARRDDLGADLLVHLGPQDRGPPGDRRARVRPGVARARRRGAARRSVDAGGDDAVALDRRLRGGRRARRGRRRRAGARVAAVRDRFEPRP
jgi:cysteine desulfurase